jgi:hypothetical protein
MGRHRKRELGPAIVVAGVLVAAVVTAQPVLAAGSAEFADRDCADFNSQAEAQAFFLDSGNGDPHRLDADNDGVACERLSGADAVEDEGGTDEDFVLPDDEPLEGKGYGMVPPIEPELQEKFTPGREVGEPK